MNRSSKSSSLLALGLLVFLALACSSSGDSNSATSTTDTAASPKPTSTEFKIDVAEMRKDDGEGAISEEVTNTFPQQDKKIHCYLNWDNSKAGTKIKFVFIATEAGGAKNVTVKEVSLVTENELQNEAHGSLKLSKPLPKGSYKVDIYVNDKIERTLPFNII